MLNVLLFKTEVEGDGGHKGSPSVSTHPDLWSTAEVTGKGFWLHPMLFHPRI